jgi:hypothetical protein
LQLDNKIKKGFIKGSIGPLESSMLGSKKQFKAKCGVSYIEPHAMNKLSEEEK